MMEGEGGAAIANVRIRDAAAYPFFVPIPIPIWTATI
jgi:hypothetical protein